MIVGLSPTFSEDILSKSDAVIKLSNDLKKFMNNKNYGESVENFAIEIICVAPEFEGLIKARKTRYIKSRNALEYDLKLNFSLIKNASNSTIIKTIIREIINSIPKLQKVNIPHFETGAFISEMVDFLKSYNEKNT